MERVSALACRLGQEAEAVCRMFLPHGRRQGRYWQVGDVLGTPGRSLYVRLTGERAGRWADAATAEHGDLLDLIARNRGLSFTDAVAEARSFLRLSAPPPVAFAREPPGPAGSPEAARRLFAASRPIAGTLAERYLARRGIALPDPVPALRFHPRCYHLGPRGREVWPALVAAVTDGTGAITGVHRTWLDPATAGKAPLDQPRRAMGHLLGHGVRFGAADDVLAAGEGIETVLALRMALPGLPAVAALSAAHLAALLFPPGLRRLYVARDADAAGARALERLTARGRTCGVEVRPLVPRAEDANADLLVLGLDGLHGWLLAQLVPEDRRRFGPPRGGP